MRAGDWVVVGLAILYTVIALFVRHRATRYFRPGVSGWTRRGIGWGMLRRDNYTAEGRSAHRWLVVLWLGALPLFALLVLLIAVVGR